MTITRTGRPQTLGQRARAFVTNLITRRPMKRRPTATKQRRMFALWPGWQAQAAEWVLTNQDQYIDEGFNLNAVVYAAIMYKTRSAQSAAMRAWMGTEDEHEPLPAAHPLSVLLQRPNPNQSFVTYDSLQRVYFNLFGNAYTVFFRERRGDFPSSFIGLRPDRVRHLYGKNKPKLRGYLYIRPGATPSSGVPIPVEDVMHVKLPNPGDPFAGMGKGLSPLFPGGQSVDVDNALTTFLKKFIDYGAMPPHVLSFDADLTDDQVAQTRERWQEIYGGSYHWTDVAVLDNSGSIQQIGSKLDELASEELDARNAGRITMCFGVPLPLIETNPRIVQSTYSNLGTYEKFFWNNTMIPELRWFQTEFIYYLRGDDGSFPAYDFSNIPALQEVRDKRAQLVLDAWKSSAATRADVRRSLGLDVGPGDDVYAVPLTMQLIPAMPKPADTEQGGAQATLDEEQREEEAPQEPESEPSEDMAALPWRNTKANPLTLEQKQILWKQFVTTAESFEAPAQRAANEALSNDEREILALINEAKSAAYKEAKAITWDIVFMGVATYLQNQSKAMWRSVFDPLFLTVTAAQIDRLNETFGQEATLAEVMAASDFISGYKFEFVDPIAQTSVDELKAMFDTAAVEGWSVPRMTENLQLIFQQWIDGNLGDMSEEARELTYFATQRLPPHRSTTIARTEMLRASNAASVGTYKAWGVPQKEWLSTPGPRTRDSHRVGASWGAPLVVGIDEPFEIGGSLLQFPGDPNAPLEQTAQCRCTTLPVI